MSQSIANLCTEIRTDLQRLPDVRTYQTVPDSINEWPAVVVLPVRGSNYLASHGRQDGVAPLASVVDMQVEVHIPRANSLDAAMAFLTTMAGVVPLRLYEGFTHDRFNGTMITGGSPNLSNNSIPPITWEIAPSAWDSTETNALVLVFQITLEQEVFS